MTKFQQQFCLFLFFLASTLVDAKECNSTTCCYPDGVGCFSKLPPFDDLPLPEDPEKIPPNYWRYRLPTGNETFGPVAVDDPNVLDTNNLIVMTHGYSGNMYNTPWRELIIRELLKSRPNYDILFIDWAKGADQYITFSGYRQAASNTRMIGAMATEWFFRNPKFNPAKTYCIGFSLGTHVCGFMAKHRQFKWERLTALDPARPWFDKTDPRARVDKSDALFMDVVHTSSTEGMQRPIGHVDLWVNNAKHQPGCGRFFRQRVRKAAPSQKLAFEYRVPTDIRLPSDVSVGSFIDHITDYVGCSHERAATLFQLSINLPQRCDFQPFCPCTYSETEGVKMLNGNDTCTPEEWQHFGYHILPTRLGSFCGKTATALPFYSCSTTTTATTNVKPPQIAIIQLSPHNI